MDLKTLKLATLLLTPERLDAFVTYQRTMLSELAQRSSGDWSGRYAFAHGKALAESKLDLVDYGKLKALVGDFCGRRSAYQQVKARIDAATEKDAPLLARAKTELPKLNDMSAFEARHGAEALALLRSREEELVKLHRELAHLEGGGHVHIS
ncbi:MAG: hypothetical protein DI536_11790 [Archangium gephyra]|uniref:Uncharacterized protein n=1 Tax=Archangium gephyra TaxID=48 RepID=A0A2W5TRN2_9BACT|nr:MAG: hypothetical protein DI536_11790 [Archangium gephyra]